MKIVEVNPFFHPYNGGIEYRMHDVCASLAKKGHDVTVLTSQLPGTESEEITPSGYRILRLKSSFINVYNPPFVTSYGISEALESLNPDIVNYHYRWAPCYNRTLGKYDGKKVFTYHNIWGEGIGIQRAGSEINDFVFRSHLDTFDHIVTVCDYVKNDLLRRGYGAGEVTKVANGLSVFPTEPGPGDGDFILSLGRLVKVKGLKYLVKAMKEVDFKLVICGRGPESKHLAIQIAKEGLGDKIELRGWVTDEEKKRLMRSCRMFVMPTIYDAFGIAALELMAEGRPIISTNAGGMPETVGNGGILIPPKDPKALAEAINRLLNDRDLCEELGRNAAKQAELYRWENLLPGLEEVYSKVLSGEYVRRSKR